MMDPKVEKFISLVEHHTEWRFSEPDDADDSEYGEYELTGRAPNGEELFLTLYGNTPVELCESMEEIWISFDVDKHIGENEPETIVFYEEEVDNAKAIQTLYADTARDFRVLAEFVEKYDPITTVDGFLDFLRNFRRGI